MKISEVRTLAERGSVRTVLAKTDDGTLVVVKTLRLQTAGEEAWRLFEREARTLRVLDHPQIPRYLQSWKHEEGGEVFFHVAQQYVAGKSLAALIDDGQRFTEEAVRQLGVELCRVLSYLHELRPEVVHRDIKPSNIIIGDDGGVYLVDFGAVTAAKPSGETVVGTFGYMPPEQLEGRACPASDVYALGMTLLCCLTHRAPHEYDDGPRQAVRRVFDARLRAALTSFIALDADERPASGAAALRSLQAPAPRVEVALPVQKQRGAAIAGAVIFVLGLGVFGGLMTYRSFTAQRPSPPPIAPAPSAPSTVKEPVRGDMGAGVDCWLRGARIMQARDRYRSWTKGKEPTCKERHVYGLYSAYEDTASVCRAAAERARASEVAPYFLKLASIADDMGPLLQKADRYYDDEDYRFDDCKGAKSMHEALSRGFASTLDVYRKLTPLLDARIGAAEGGGERARAYAGVLRALAEVVRHAPVLTGDPYDRAAARAALGPALAAFDHLEAIAPPSLPGPAGVWEGYRQQAETTVRRVKTIVRNGKRMRRGATLDPTGVRVPFYEMARATGRVRFP